MSFMEKLLDPVTAERNLQEENEQLVKKWTKFGLLEGLNDTWKKGSIARLLENQASQVKKERKLLAESTTAAGTEGFAAVSFPIVRRVFGSLIAHDLVSVQPMSLPAGLIFFMDFKYGTNRGQFAKTDSLYGGGVVGSQITGGVSLTGVNLEKGLYSLNQGYASPITSSTATLTAVASGTVGAGTAAQLAGYTAYTLDQLVEFDPDLSGSTVSVFSLAYPAVLNTDALVTLQVSGASAVQARRLTHKDPTSPLTKLLVVIAASGSEASTVVSGAWSGAKTVSYAAKDQFGSANALGALAASQLLFESDATTVSGNFGDSTAIPELDIKVDSISVTAITKKLRAKWSPELGQDLQAYHNIEAEVELTSILSEQIALEIDQEILEDLFRGATAAVKYWSRRPGKFVNRDNGQTSSGSFTGNVSMWYETLLETINDVSAQIHRKTLRGGANFVVCSPEVANLLEFTGGFKASAVADEVKGGEVGAVKVGSLSKKFDVYVQAYFARNVILVGRKGKSFLESGYVYAPYVPLQTTPTIFGTEDFVPRKGVMTRYAKKMVRPDLYGLVVVQDLIG